MEHILGFIQAAERKRSPLIIQFFPWAIKFPHGLLIHAAAQGAKSASVPIAIHLDHCQDADLGKEAAGLPFDSIMIDMSQKPREENLSRTTELVRYCQERGIATEAEPGRIKGGEDGISDTVDLTPLLTTAEQAGLFVSSGVDILAPAFGNVHGQYGPRGVVLDWDR